MSHGRLYSSYLQKQAGRCNRDNLRPEVAGATSKQITRLLQALQFECIQGIEHAPALIIEPTDALLLVRECSSQLAHKVFVAAPDLDLQALRTGLKALCTADSRPANKSGNQAMSAEYPITAAGGRQEFQQAMALVASAMYSSFLGDRLPWHACTMRFWPMLSCSRECCCLMEPSLQTSSHEYISALIRG